MAEFLVTMRPTEYYSFTDVIIVEADNFDKCIEFAFFTRNIAASWCISDVESDDADVPPITRDILFTEFANWHWKNKQFPNKRVSWIDYYKEMQK